MAWRVSQGRVRKMAADHQGSQHQAGIGEHMKLPPRKFLPLAAGSAALPVLPRIARAQAYPTRPVRIIVGYPAGGGSDIVARLISRWLSERFGQQFVVENRPGAGTNIATESA